MLRKKQIIGITIITIALAVVLMNFLSSCSVRSYTVSELLEKGEALHGKTVRLDGEIAAGSVIKSADSLIIKFILIDENNIDSIPVTFAGTEPENFSEGRGVSIKGRMDKNGQFIAEEIYTKCASKYVPEE